MKDKDFKTKCIHGYDQAYDTTGAVSVPIFQSATFSHIGLGQSTGFDYSRLQNPTREHLEKTVASLEEGVDAIAFSTGMAAITTLMAHFKPGDHIIASEDLYGGSHRLFHTISMQNGVEFDFLDTSDLHGVESKVKATTKAIYVETPTNPMMQVTDIGAIAELIKGKEILLIVDNTFLTPYFQKPILFGADVVIHSGTKFLGGHNDTLAGLLVFKNVALLEEIRYIAKTFGACLSPFDSWLIIRGIKTLAIRMEHQQKSAIAVAEWLDQQTWVKNVYYSGCSSSAGYEIMKKHATGFGSMISIELDKVERVKTVLEGVKVIQFAESLGGVESLITYPSTQTHADIPEEERNEKGITDCLLRLSIGLEDIEDLIKDLEQAAGGQ